MTPQWQRLKEIFNAAAELPVHERAALLDRFCTGDENLRREIESLLAHDETSERFIEAGMLALGNSQFAVTETAPTPESVWEIGPYHIVREIGSGGMGVVYEAVRDDEFKKKVALKVVKRGMDTAAIVKRFRLERQILAGLSHPNITGLLDGGTTPDGRPYFVMEYVEGQPIADYCDANKLTIRQRLEIFRLVCDAVQYAHQNLVVHRDLKPSNILVTRDGVPKLLDFGIAKILNLGVVSGTLDLTLASMRVMTPEYSSPEQIRGEPITTSTDVYSLGVLLYALLTGRHPYRFKTRTPEAISRAICEQQPEKPSIVITRVEQQDGEGSGEQILTPQTVSATREGPPQQLQRQLRGDLDNILLKALHKEPSRRYASVEQFSEDIRRHLARLPVMARSDTFAYRTGKFILRHKAGVLAAASVALALIVGMAATTWEARIANTERIRAERRFQDVRTLANSLLFELHDAIQNLPGATPVREVLVKRALQYLDSLSRESAGDLTLRGELAAAYEKVGDVQGGFRSSNLGDQAGAIASYRKALAIRESLAAVTPGDFELQRLIVRTHGKLSELLLQAGNHAEAMEHSLKLLPIAERLAARDPDNLEDQRNLASAYTDVGSKQTGTGDWKAGLDNLRKGVALFEKLAAAHPSDIEIQRRLAVAYDRTGQVIVTNTQSYGEALALHRKALALTEQLYTAAPLNTQLRRIAAYAHLALGNDLLFTKNPTDAAPHFAKAAAEFQSLSAADPKNVQYRTDAAMGLGVEAEAAIETGQAARGIANLKKALAMLSEPLGPQSKDLVAVNQFRMGRAYSRLGRSREACPWFERSLPGLLEAQQRNRSDGQDSERIVEVREAIRNCPGPVAIR
jgi:non-specific serine/threonine protein kinase/serine/threonine-protein kinase